MARRPPASTLSSMGGSNTRSVPVAAIGLALIAGCGMPHLARDGTLVFPEQGARGAAVLTANGVEFRDRADIPSRVVHRDANEPWRAPIGFILPKSGRFKETSRPTIIATPGLAVVLRPSDTRVPSWGGEILVRLELIAPASSEQARPPERIAYVVDSAAADVEALSTLVESSLDSLGALDRVSALDDSGRIVIRPVPGRYRTLVSAAIEKYEDDPRRAARPLAALAAAAQITGATGAGVRRIVFFTDAAQPAWNDPAVTKEVERLAGEGVRLSFIGITPHAQADRLGALAMAGAGVAGTGRPLEDRAFSAKLAVPASGEVRYRDVVVSFSGVPAPSRVIEASGGEVRWRLDAGELYLGDFAAGEARAEVLRVSVPGWVPGETFALRAETRFTEAESGEERTIAGEIATVYDEDIERIAESRAGDVIAFASALATVKRLDRAFAGAGVDQVGGLRALALKHAKSMSLLARDTQDAAIREQAEVLQALLGSQN